MYQTGESDWLNMIVMRLFRHVASDCLSVS